MTRNVPAIFENGVLRPLEPVNLAENERVTLSIGKSSGDELLDTEFLAACANEADPSISLEAVRAALAKIPGSMTADFIAERDER